MLAQLPPPPSPIPPQRRRPGRKPATDLAKGVLCPDGHGPVDGHRNSVRFDRLQETGILYTRVGYRCRHWGYDEKQKVWCWREHRFTGVPPGEPLSLRRKTCNHPKGEHCSHCGSKPAMNGGLAAGRGFIYIGQEIAGLQITAGKGEALRRATREMRSQAYRLRPPTRSHRQPQEEDEPYIDPDEYADLEAMDEAYAEQQNTDRTWAMRDESAHDTYFIDEDHGDDSWSMEEYGPLTLEALVESALGEEDPIDPEYDEEDSIPSGPSVASGSFALGAEYIDQFAAVCTEPTRRTSWTEVLIIDSLPVRRGPGPRKPKKDQDLVSNEVPSPEDRDQETEEKRPDFMFEIMGAVGQENGRSELIALYPAGTKDFVSCQEFFATKAGAPSWIVSDMDKAIAKAIELTWPGATHFICREHLRRRIKVAATKDRVREGTAVWEAINRAQSSIENWDGFIELVEAGVPVGRRALRNWIAANDGLIRRQVELVTESPHRPRSTGNLEADLVRIRANFAGRKRTLRNRGRLVKLLELMRAEESGHADLDEYAVRIVASLTAIKDSKTKIAWDSTWDHFGENKKTGKPIIRNSILEFRDRAKQRYAYSMVSEDRARSAQTREEIKEQAAEKAAASGGTLYVRTERSAPHGPVSLPGQKVADVPLLMRYWDKAKNDAAGHDPTRMAGQSNTKVHWLCDKHLVPPDDANWPGHLHEWEQSPASRGGHGADCARCVGTEACPANCLRTVRPDLAAEWDYAANGDLTPDNVTHGSQKKVMWICLKGHPSYPMGIRTRSNSTAGCEECRKERVNAKHLATQRDTRAEQRRLAKESEQASVVVPPPDDNIFF